MFAECNSTPYSFDIANISETGLTGLRDVIVFDYFCSKEESASNGYQCKLAAKRWAFVTRSCAQTTTWPPNLFSLS